MAVFPCVCDTCGRFEIVQTPLLGKGSAKVTFETMHFPNSCPQFRCEGDLYGLSGTYDVIDGVGQFVKGPEESEDQFRRFLNVVDQAVADRLTTEEFIQRVEQEAPEFYSHFQGEMDFDRLLDILGLILMLVPGLLNVYLQYVGLQQDQEQHDELVQQQQEHHEEMMEQAAEQANNLNETDVRAIVRQFIEVMENQAEKDTESDNDATEKRPDPTDG